MSLIMDVLDDALRLRRLTAKQAAEKFGVGNQQITKKVRMQETIAAKQYFAWLDQLDIDVELYYKDNGERIVLEKVPLSMQEVFKQVTEHYGLSMYAAARKCGFGEQSFVQKVTQRDSLRAKEFFEDMAKLGVKWKIVVRETGEELSKAVAKTRVIGNSDNQRFDTKDAQFILTTFGYGGQKYGADGKAVDLYKGDDGHYFVAEFFKDGESRIRTVADHVAKALMEKYGGK